MLSGTLEDPQKVVQETTTNSFWKRKIDQLAVGYIHSGMYVEGTIVSNPMKMSGVHLTLSDDKHFQITCSLYDYKGTRPQGIVIDRTTEEEFLIDRSNTFGLKKGQRIRILDPWCKVAADGQNIIRVEDLQNIQIL